MGQLLTPTPAWPWLGPTGLRIFNDSLHLPFDLMRAQHAEAVQAGLLAKSMLASREFERSLDLLEHLALGPFARSV